MVYARVQDVEALWRPLGQDEKTRAEALLRFAEAIIKQRFKDLDARVQAGELTPDIVVMIEANMVRRAMVVPVEGVTQQAETNGPFSTSQTFANPMGNLYLSKDDLRLLGVTKSGRAFAVDMTPTSLPSY
jgi:hypothetical protein